MLYLIFNIYKDKSRVILYEIYLISLGDVTRRSHRKHTSFSF